jgi:hypothetical protein
MTLVEAAIVASELVLIIIVAVVIGRACGHFLVSHLHNYARTQCRRTDSLRVDRIHEAAGEAHKQAKEARMAAEALERHLKGAAHV